MKLRMYLRGLGLGMIVAALVLSFGLKDNKKTLTDSEIKARARELGMVEETGTLAEAVSEKDKSKTVDEPEEVQEEVANEPTVDTEENVEEAKAEESDTEKADEAEKADTEDAEAKAAEEAKKKAEEDLKAAEAKAAEEEKAKAEEEAKKKAEEEAKKKAEEEAKKKAEEEAKKKAEEEAKKKAEEEAKKRAEAEKAAKSTGTANKAYTLRIEHGYSSDRVANILQSAGVIDSASGFDKYLCSNGYDHRISVGTYSIQKGADYSTIAKMITNTK